MVGSPYFGTFTFQILTGLLAGAAEDAVADPQPRGRSLCQPRSHYVLTM